MPQKVKKTPKSPTARKNEVMQWLGISSEEYTKQLKVFGNRVRSLQKIAGKASSASPSYLFHDYAYRMKFKAGELSSTLAGVLAAPASSSNAPTSAAARKRVEEKYLLRPFRGLMKRSPEYTKNIINNGSLTIDQKVKALSDYAQRVHEKQNLQRAKNDELLAGGVIIEDVDEIFPGDFYED